MDEDKPKEQLLEEMATLRRRVADLETAGLDPAQSRCAFREDAAKLKAILETTVDGMITINERAIVQSFNKAAERIFGYPADEIIGKNVNTLMPSPYRENHDAYVGNYLSTGIRKIIGIGREVTGRRKDGSTFPLYLAVSEVPVDQGRLFAGILRDVTELKRATDEIKSVAKFPEEAPNPVLRAAGDGRLLYANPGSELFLKTVNVRVDESLPDRWRELIRDSLRLGAVREVEERCGDTVYSMALAPIMDGGYVNIYGRDITERKRAEEDLRASEQKHRTLVESSSDAILLVDTERRIVSFNGAFLQLFGFKWYEVAGKSMRILHPDDASFVSFGETAYPEIEEKGFFRTEWTLVRKDGGHVPVEETFSAIRSPDGSASGFVAVLRDITQRKQTEAELERYRDRLEEMVLEKTRDLENAHKALLQKEKLKTLGAISAELAHEIRNPLMSIGGFAKRLKAKYPDASEVDIIVNESWRLEKILDRISNYLKPVELRPQESSVTAIITESVDLLSHELDREVVALDLHLAPGLPHAYVDPGILIQVIINVIRNASKVMNQGGRITIETFESDLNIHVYVKAPITGVKVKDPEHMFLPFGEDRHTPSMPICFRLLKDMGGLLTFQQEEDSVVFAATLLKALHPHSEVDEMTG